MLHDLQILCYVLRLSYGKGFLSPNEDSVVNMVSRNADYVLVTGNRILQIYTPPQDGRGPILFLLRTWILLGIILSLFQDIVPTRERFRAQNDPI